jgi:hypothetical protein
MRAVSTMTDLHPIDFQSAVQNARRTTLLKALPRGTQIVSEVNDAAAKPGAAQHSSDNTQPVIEIPVAGTTDSAPPKSRNRKTRSAEISSTCLLVQTTTSGIAEKISAHTSLLEAGLIGTWHELQRHDLLLPGSISRRTVVQRLCTLVRPYAIRERDGSHAGPLRPAARGCYRRFAETLGTNHISTADGPSLHSRFDHRPAHHSALLQSISEH